MPPTTTATQSSSPPVESRAPIDRVLEPPTLVARLSCAGLLVGLLAVWGNWAFLPEHETPGHGRPIHSMTVPMGFTLFYLTSLPLLKRFRETYLDGVDVKCLLRESMILYNFAQVLLNGFMVYRILKALFVTKELAFMGGDPTVDTSGASYAVWIHYCDKYLEYLDTYFMILRGRMDQVSFLHIYHHASIAIAWWIGIRLHPGGDIYFGALINSWIHVMMYSYYTLSLLKISCPWKKYLTLAQLTQFVSVLAFSFCCIYRRMTETSAPSQDGAAAADSSEDSSTSWKVYTCHLVQDFEMLSLFFLFLHFYRKAYHTRKAAAALKRQNTSADSATSASEEDTSSLEQESISSVGSNE